MPTDETEQDRYFLTKHSRINASYGVSMHKLTLQLNRLDLYHEIYLVAWNDNLHEAPLTTPHRILDIGTGTGIWAIDMADKYPMAEVIGTDLSPIQPSWIPANW